MTRRFRLAPGPVLAVFSLALLGPTGAASAEPKATPQPAAQAQNIGPAAITLTIQDGYEIVELPSAAGRVSYAEAIAANGQVGGEDRVGDGKDPRAALWSAQGAESFPRGSGWSEIVGFTPSGEAISRTDDQGYKGNSPIGDSLIFGGGVPLGVTTQGKPVGTKYRFEKKNGADTAVGFLAWAQGETLKAAAGFTDSYAYGGNSAGTIVGAACNGITSGTPTRAVRWDKSGNAVLLPGKGSGAHGYAIAVDDKGVIVGAAGTGDSVRAAKWANDQLTELGSLGGKSIANAISPTGVIVGSSHDADGDAHGVVFRNGQAVDLNTLIHRPGLNGAQPAGMAATAKVLTAAERLAVIVNDWFIQAAADVNDKGEIAAWASKLGKTHAIILKPTYKKVTIATSEEVKSGMRSAKPPRSSRLANKEFPHVVLKQKP